MEMIYMYFDFHIHSIYSYDSMLKLETIIKHSKKKGLSGIAITDHNTILGAKKAKSFSSEDFLVIIGAEIKTDRGEIIGLFLNDEIHSTEFNEVRDEIKAQGGLIVLPHPFKNKAVNPELLTKEVDLIEGLNARIKPELNHKACILAKKYGLPIIAGSDAHTSFEIGAVQNKLQIDELSLEEVRKNMLKGTAIPFGTESPFYIRMLSRGMGRYEQDGALGVMKSIYKNIGDVF
jgi:predicted metal-dependent phosphoesterase TrpH